MKKMKKLISLLVAATMLCAVVVLFAGCNPFATSVYGTEAAKILLARERMDANTIGKKLDIFDTESLSDLLSAPTLDGSTQLSANAFSGLLPLAHHSEIRPNGDAIEWNNFSSHSTMKDNYTQFTDDIDRRTAEIAEMIGWMKQNVGVTDKWIEQGGNRYLLSVQESREILIEASGNEGYLYMGVRYTTADAKNVYEIYNFWEDEAESGDVRLLCIPGERYEYMYQHSDGFTDYFIADNSCGYWQTNRFSFNEDGAYFTLIVTKDGVGYGSDVSLVYGDNGELVIQSGYNGSWNARAFLPGENRDLFSIATGGEKNYFDVYMSNVSGGVVSLGIYGDLAENVFTEDVNDTLTYSVINTQAVQINLANGGSIRAGEGNGIVTYTGSYVDYSPEFNGDCYCGYMSFEVNEQDFSKAYEALLAYLQDNGITLSADAGVLRTVYGHTALLLQNPDLTEWYGRRLNSYGALVAGEQALEADYAAMKDLFARVKENETLRGWYVVDASVNFEDLTLAEGGSAVYANGVVSVQDVVATVTGSGLMETGVSYALQIGLAKRDGNGNVSSVHTVPLEEKNTLQTAAYSSGSLTLQQTAEFSLPTVLSEGKYVVVLYVATADEGIRVSEMLPLVFLSVEEGKIASELMDVTVSHDGGRMFVDVAVRLEEWIASDQSAASYSYEDVRRILMRGVLAKGYPITDAQVQNENGGVLATDAQLGAGTYRIKFLTSREGVMVEAYMYCTLQTS